MAEYTIELRKIEKFGKVFNFDYDFYCDDESMKTEFEKKFTDYYYFDEIGFETVGRFKHNLRSKLNLIMPYYKQLYITELEAQKIDFLLNKDLREEFIRTVDNEYENNGTNSGTSKAKSDSNSKNTSNGKSTTSESRLDNGVADVNLRNLTGVVGVEDTSTVAGTESNSSSNELKSNSNDKGNNKTEEKTVLISKGNIGVTSSAELLEKWRSVIINIDRQIIEECRDLFMLIY